LIEFTKINNIYYIIMVIKKGKRSKKVVKKRSKIVKKQKKSVKKGGKRSFRNKGKGGGHAVPKFRPWLLQPQTTQPTQPPDTTITNPIVQLPDLYANTYQTSIFEPSVPLEYDSTLLIEDDDI